MHSINSTRDRLLREMDLSPVKKELNPREITEGFFKKHYENSVLSQGSESIASRGRAQTVKYQEISPRSSTADLAQLEPILFRDLISYKVHKGFYVLCRITSLAISNGYSQFLAEDVKGDITTILIDHDFRVRDFGTGKAELSGLFPIGANLVIKEPNFNGKVQIDSPSDLVYIPSTSPLLDNIKWSTPNRFNYSSSDYRALGDEFYKKKDFTVAQFLFTQAIEATPVDSSTKLLPLYRNRSMAALSAKNFGTSARDCKKILEMLELGTPVPKNDPALVENTIKRLANAQYGQRKFTTALSTFHRLAKEFPSNGAGRIGIGRCEKRLEESRTGNYDWESIISQVSNFRVAEEITYNVDVGNYYNPGIEIQKVEGTGGGRGIFATRDIKAGEMLIVEKSFASVFMSPNRLFDILPFNIILNGSDQAPLQVALATEVSARVNDNPFIFDLVNLLYAGEELEVIIGEPRIPRVTDQEVEKSDFGGKLKADIEIGRVEEVVAKNSFQLSATTGQNSPHAIYAVTSYLNHACIGKTRASNLGDLKRIEATSDIKAGEEITIEYIPGDLQYAQRESYFLKAFGKQCECSKCVGKERLEIPRRVKE